MPSAFDGQPEMVEYKAQMFGIKQEEQNINEFDSLVPYNLAQNLTAPITPPPRITAGSARYDQKINIHNVQSLNVRASLQPWEYLVDHSDILKSERTHTAIDDSLIENSTRRINSLFNHLDNVLKQFLFLIRSTCYMYPTYSQDS